MTAEPGPTGNPQPAQTERRASLNPEFSWCLQGFPLDLLQDFIAQLETQFAPK